MALTAQDIIKDSLELLGIYAPGEILPDSDAERGLKVMNAMLDSWSNESLACYAILEQSGPLQVGKSAYTIGPGGDFDMTRPLKILDGYGTAYVQDANGNNYSIRVVPRDYWNTLGNRTNVVNSNFPDTLFYDPQYPLGIINVFPVPNISYTMFWDSNAQLSDLASLTTPFTFPPGYERAVVTNLALALKPYFSAGELDPLVLAEAAKTLGSVKRTNMRPIVAVMDDPLISRGQLSYNPYTDRSGSGTG